MPNPLLNAAAFLVRSSLGLFQPMAATVPASLAIGLVFLVFGIAIWRRIHPRKVIEPKYTLAKWIVELLSLLAIPIIMISIALYTWPQNGFHAPHEGVALHTVATLWVLQMVLGIFLVWRHRKRFWLTLVISGCAIVWATGTNITAATAIGNQWL